MSESQIIHPPTRTVEPADAVPTFDPALLHRVSGLFTHRYCVKLLALCVTEPRSRQALRMLARASNAGLDGAIKELRRLELITKVIGDEDNPVFEITELGRKVVGVMNVLSDGLHDIWADQPRAPRTEPVAATR